MQRTIKLYRYLNIQSNIIKYLCIPQVFTKRFYVSYTVHFIGGNIMNALNRLWRKSIFRNLVISFICILSPIYLLIIVIYNNGIYTLRKEISKSVTSQVSSYLKGLENDIKRIRTLQFDFIGDIDLNRIATIPEAMSDIEKKESILSIQRRATAIKNSSVYIKDVMIFVPAADRIIFSSNISQFDQDQFDKLKKIPELPNAQVMNIDGRMFLSCIYPVPRVNSDRQPIFIIAIELSKEKIEEALVSMINNPGEGVIFIEPVKQSVISTNKDINFIKKIQELIDTDDKTQADKTISTVIDNKRYLVVASSSAFFDSMLCKYLPEDSVFEPIRRHRIWFVILTITALFIIVTYSLYLHRFIHRPLSRLAYSFRQVESGNLDISIEHKHDDEFQYIYKRFNAMVEKLNSLIDQVYKQRIFAQKAELKQLQSQINPHFLYNSFFILNTMSRIGDYENIEKFTEQLGEYFQFITRSAADEVPLFKEVNHARVYTDIQAMRFSNRVRVRFDELPEEYYNIMVPRLILQPIIENAFEHGLEKKTENGLLLVSFVKCDGYLKIIFEDNGLEIDDEKLKGLQDSLSSKNDEIEITGMINIHRRLQLKFGPDCGLQLMKGELGGLKAVITIKITGGTQDVQIIDRR